MSATDRVCHEAVIRAGGIEEPCNRPAVGYRLDEGSPYPVCRKHHRPPYWLTARTEAGIRLKDDDYAARWDADAAAIKRGAL